ncbi:MAG: sulfotransferase [Calditrichaeota bacterium]|nr:sulfotransferase [Calditrichota bacterium]
MSNRTHTNKKAPVFVVGAPRSGTTFLTKLMNTFLDIHVARDAGVFLRFYKMLPGFGDLSRRENMEQLIRRLFKDHFFKIRILERGLNLTVDQVLEQFKGTTYTELIDFLMFEMARQQGKSRWGNKRPSYALHITELAELFPHARILHIVRDGRDVAYSMRRAGQGAFERNWYYAIKDWEHHVCVARESGNRLPEGQYLEIKYEDLMKTPIEVLQKIIHFMGDEAENEERLRNSAERIRAMIKPGNYEKWRRQIPPFAVKIMEQAAGDTLEAFGYPILYPQLIGQPFHPVQKVWFFVDNVVGKVFSPAVKKSITYRFHWLKTRWRIAGLALWYEAGMWI